MPDTIERELRDILSRFVTGQIGFEEFDDLLSQYVSDTPSSSVAADLLFSTQLALSEYDCGHRTYRELVSHIEGLVLYGEVQVGATGVVTDLRTAGTSPEVEFSS